MEQKDNTLDIPQRTVGQWEAATALCRKIFSAKLQDYGAAWRLMRPRSVTDQLLIKADRIRSLETKGHACVEDESILDGFIAIVNYGAIALIQLQLGYSSRKDISPQEAQHLYDQKLQQALRLMAAKNHDYDEAWRKMRVSSYTDLILMKIMRTKEIEDHQGQTLVSEGVEANYLDMMIYSVFGIIKLTEAAQSNECASSTVANIAMEHED